MDRRFVLLLVFIYVLLGFPVFLVAEEDWLGAILSFSTVYILTWTLIAVWSYAEIARDQLGTQRAEWRIANKPIVVTERMEEPRPRDCNYYIRNVGMGTAINVWYVDEIGGQRRLRSLGALAPNGSRLLIGEIENHLRKSNGVFRHLLCAEGIISRTAQWTVTVNARAQMAGGAMTHRLADIKQVKHERSIESLLTDEAQALDDQLGALPLPD